MIRWPQSFPFSGLANLVMKKEKHPWYKPRGYVHFDAPLGLVGAEKLAQNPDKVARHSFYPFIRYGVTTQKVAKNSVTRKVYRKDPKLRHIAFASHADAHIYAYYSHVLGAAYEERIKCYGLGGSVLAFRSLGKSNIEFANDAFNEICRVGECFVFATDITGFFDNLDHQILKKAWIDLVGFESLPKDHYAVFRSLTNYSYVIKGELFDLLGFSENNAPRAPSRFCSPRDFREKVRYSGLVRRHGEVKGIPQGSPISAMLSNLYLLEFDRVLRAEVASRGGTYYRYCDDILCVIPFGNEVGVLELVENLISKFGLKINEKKTESIFFREIAGVLVAERPLQYLGFTFDGSRKLIRSAAFAKFSEKYRRGVSLARQTARKYKFTKGVKGVWRRQLYERYSHLGKRNFIRYGLRAAAVMQSRGIRRQLRPLWPRLLKRIEDANSRI